MCVKASTPHYIFTPAVPHTNPPRCTVMCPVTLSVAPSLSWAKKTKPAPGTFVNPSFLSGARPLKIAPPSNNLQVNKHN